MLKNYQKESKLKSQQSYKRVLHTMIVSEKQIEQPDMDHIDLRRTKKQENNKQQQIQSHQQQKNQEKSQIGTDKHSQKQQQNYKKKKHVIRVHSNFNAIADIGLDSDQNNSVHQEDIQNISQLNIDHDNQSLASQVDSDYNRTSNHNHISIQNVHKNDKNEKMNKFYQFKKKHHLNNLINPNHQIDDKLTQKIRIQTNSDEKNHKYITSIPKYQNKQRIQTIFQKFSYEKRINQFNEDHRENKENISKKTKIQKQTQIAKNYSFRKQTQQQQFAPSLSVNNKKTISTESPNKSMNYKLNPIGRNYSNNEKKSKNQQKNLFIKSKSKIFKDIEDKIQTQESLQSNIQHFKAEIMFIDQKMKKNKLQKHKINQFKQRLLQKLIIIQPKVKKAQKKQDKKKKNNQKFIKQKDPKIEKNPSLSSQQKQKQIQIQTTPKKQLENQIIKEQQRQSSEKKNEILIIEQQIQMQSKKVENPVIMKQQKQEFTQTDRKLIKIILPPKREEQKQIKSIRKIDNKQTGRNKHVSFQIPNQDESQQSDCISFLKKLCCL